MVRRFFCFEAYNLFTEFINSHVYLIEAPTRHAKGDYQKLRMMESQGKQQVKNNDVIPRIWAEGKVYLLWSASALMNAMFLVIWILLQIGIGIAVKQVAFLIQVSDSEIDPALDRLFWISDQFMVIIFLSFQVLFAVSTISPIAHFVYKDIQKMWLRTYNKSWEGTDK